LDSEVEEGRHRHIACSIVQKEKGLAIHLGEEGELQIFAGGKRREERNGLAFRTWKGMKEEEKALIFFLPEKRTAAASGTEKRSCPSRGENLHRQAKGEECMKRGGRRKNIVTFRIRLPDEWWEVRSCQ